MLDSRWHLAVRITAGVIALILALVLVSASLTFFWAVLVALLAGVAAVIAGFLAACPGSGRARGGQSDPRASRLILLQSSRHFWTQNVS